MRVEGLYHESLCEELIVTDHLIHRHLLSFKLALHTTPLQHHAFTTTATSTTPISTAAASTSTSTNSATTTTHRSVCADDARKQHALSSGSRHRRSRAEGAGGREAARQRGVCVCVCMRARAGDATCWTCTRVRSTSSSGGAGVPLSAFHWNSLSSFFLLSPAPAPAPALVCPTAAFGFLLVVVDFSRGPGVRRGAVDSRDADDSCVWRREVEREAASQDDVGAT